MYKTLLVLLFLFGLDKDYWLRRILLTRELCNTHLILLFALVRNKLDAKGNFSFEFPIYGHFR